MDDPMDFEIVGPVEDAETIAEGRGIRELSRLIKAYGAANGGRCGTTSDGNRIAGETESRRLLDHSRGAGRLGG
jgi:hypothetical protein